VPGLGTSLGRGGATNPPSDLQHSDCILIMGSNMAECHPVAFRFVVQAKTRLQDPATVIHVDPRFTRTSALANIYAPLRAGSDIAFLGGLVKYMLDQLSPIFTKPESELSAREQFHRDYLVRYTNAATLITDEFVDTDENEAAGLFAGFNADSRLYDVRKWRYDIPDEAGADASKPTPGRIEGTEPGLKPPSPGEEPNRPFQDIIRDLVLPPAHSDASLQHERCVFQILKRHFARYTPEMVEQVCGTSAEMFRRVASALWHCSGPDRTSAICYAVGWTQHTTGVQTIRTAAILQLLLGNIGRPSGGIIALRGHATIQGSTDIATLYDLQPGYLKTPSALRKHRNLAEYIKDYASGNSYWSNFPAFIVSQLKAWFGDAATAENEFGFSFLPQIRGDHSHQSFFVEMMKGQIKGLFAMGQNPAVGGQNATLQRKALAQLDWLVVRDLFETETASFWKDSPEVISGELKPQDIPTEVFFLPSASVPEMDGSFTNTQRLVQFHERAVDPAGDCRSDIWFTVHLGLRLKQLYQNSSRARDKPIQALMWDYIDEEANRGSRIVDEPSAHLILKEINGYHVVPGQRLKDAIPVKSFTELKHDGSTASGAWIYAGIFAPTTDEPLGHNHAANRDAEGWVPLKWGFSWPANRRVLYNRASADLRGEPWPKEQRLARELAPADRKDLRGYVWWDAAEKSWRGADVPDFIAGKAPDAAGDPNGVGVATLDGASPFIMQSDGKGWLFVPLGLKDGPLPTHYEPYESPVQNAIYKQQSNPVAHVWNIPGNRYAPVGSTEYPHVCSTYRLTEHHLSGAMSRWLPWLSELMPELFCEISPEHATELGIQNTAWVEISTPRGSVRAKALVTRRIRPLRITGKRIHLVGLPWHWGYKGVTTGDVVNDLSALVGDPNVTIHEAKVFLCNVKPA
jgi:formate dehydrogenase major subunit